MGLLVGGCVKFEGGEGGGGGLHGNIEAKYDLNCCNSCYLYIPDHLIAK